MADKKREVVGRIVERMYKHSLKSSGRLPDRKSVREMEVKAQKTAQRADNQKLRGN